MKHGLITDANGNKFWYVNGQRHREDGPACEYTDGTTSWYLHGKSHRIGGPAVEWRGGAKTWYVHGVLHRLDGPAMENHIGNKCRWFYKGKEIFCSSQREFESFLKLKAFW
jgi:hypothetical protein